MAATDNANIAYKILVVDDAPENLEMASIILRKSGYLAATAASGEEALQAAEKNSPDLILLDIMMPEMDGFEVCRRLKENPKIGDIPVIFLSSLKDTVSKVKAFTMGGVDYITKPFEIDEVAARVKTHLKIRQLQTELEKHNLDLSQLVQQQVKEISESQMATILALATLAESRDEQTGRHLERVQTMCKLLADHLGQSRFAASINQTYIDNIFHASPLHDIGKVGIPDGILLKSSQLSEAEFEIMKRHTTIGAETLETVRSKYPKNAFVNMGIAIARSHHERWDGKGYPDGLSGEDIPLCARIMTVADVYDALRSKRSYKPIFSHEKSMEMIFEQSEKQFDPRVVEGIKSLTDKFRDVWEKL